MKYVLVFLFLASCKQQNKYKIFNQKFKGVKIQTNHARRMVQDNKSLRTFIIPANDTTMLVDSLLTSVSFIPLETKKGVTIGEVSKILFLAGYFVVVDKSLSKAVFLFDEKGSFIRKIYSFGYGADQYSEVSDVAIDSKKRQIIIFDNKQSKLYYYDLSGNLIETKSIGLRFADLVKMGGDTLVFMSHNSGNDHQPSVDHHGLIIMRNREEVAFVDFEEPIYLRDFNFFSAYHLTLNENGVFIFPRFSDTIFSIGPTGVRHGYYKLQKENLVTTEFLRNELNRKMFRNKVAEKGYFYFLGHFQENSSTIFTIMYGGPRQDAFYYILIDKESGSARSISKIRMEDKFNFPGFQFPIATREDFFFGVLSTTKIFQLKELRDKSQVQPERFSKELNMLMNKIRLYDNPVLVKYKFKKFKE